MNIESDGADTRPLEDVADMGNLNFQPSTNVDESENPGGTNRVNSPTPNDKPRARINPGLRGRQ